jgi:hypothetical protein
MPFLQRARFPVVNSLCLTSGEPVTIMVIQRTTGLKPLSRVFEQPKATKGGLEKGPGPDFFNATLIVYFPDI